MRVLSVEELKRVSGGKTDWDAYNRNHGITGPVNNPYGGMPHPPNMADFGAALTEGAIIGSYFGGPIGAIEGAGIAGTTYILHNGYSNIRDYYF